jgi:hypothetical protein
LPKKLLEVAQKQVGYLEKETNKNLDSKTANAGDENYTKYARDFDKKYPNFYNGKKNGYAWCDVFVDWCFVEAYGVEKAKELLGQPDKSCGAGCEWSVKYYKQIGRFSKKPIVGAQIFFSDSKGEPCHTGIVKKIGTKYIYTIEGNTSISSQDNGGKVMQRNRYSNIVAYARPAYQQGTLTNITSHKPLEEIAMDVIRGKYGVMPERKQKLEAEGYNYEEVRAMVNKLKNK